MIGYVTGRECPLQVRMLYAAIAGDPGLGSPLGLESVVSTGSLSLDSEVPECFIWGSIEWIERTLRV